MDTYKEKYEAALERARMILCNIPEGESCKDIETIFPELRESEDERKTQHIPYIQSTRDVLLSIENKAHNILGLDDCDWVAIRASHRLLGEYIDLLEK